MTFRQFVVFLIRLQALWLIIEAINYVTYLLDYWRLMFILRVMRI
jgi:hypothetical protein